MTRTLCVAVMAAVALALGAGAAAAAPNDVIFNEYWNSDDGTAYPGLGGAAIEGDWFELLVVASPEVDLRGWRVTNNSAKAGTGNGTDQGSLIFPPAAAFAAVPSGTVILVIATDTAANDAAFPVDDTETSDRRMRLYVGNGTLDAATDPLFSIRSSDDALVLLAPGATAALADDVGVDFIAENATATPASFGVGTDGVTFPNPFTGIGGDDGCVFTHDALGGFNNDDGTLNPAPPLAGPGGWIVDPPAAFSGDDASNNNILTPGERNFGQDLSGLIPVTAAEAWEVFR